MKGRITHPPDSWQRLQGLTSARIALGRSGGSLPTHEWLDFKLSHARARDAVHCDFDFGRVENDIANLGLKTVVVDSGAGNRMTYLQRPDLGRLLSADSTRVLREFNCQCDLVVIVSDGLSALAVHTQVAPLLANLIPKLEKQQWTLGPIVIARYGRVALQDEIGKSIGAKIALILIGERPGLGSPDGLGAYLVYGPKPGNTDANRNCVSNIRPEGLNHQNAADTIYYLLKESRARNISGVALKDTRRMLEGPRVFEGK